MTPAALLQKWLAVRLPSAALHWVEQQARLLGSEGRDADLYRAFSLASRQTGKQGLALSGQDLEDALRARAHWAPAGWRIDEAARLLLLLASGTDGEVFSRRLDQLCATADVDELVTLYKGLPLYPDPARHRARAAEGIRSNMKSVFEAVAHRNPYPMEQLPEPAWNQMVLKALFVGVTLDPVLGLDERANPALATMLRDYAHERWAAHRPVSPELWRCVGRFADGPALDDLHRVLEQGSAVEQKAAMLALSQSPDPRARALMTQRPPLAEAVASGQLTWQSLVPAV